MASKRRGLNTAQRQQERQQLEVVYQTALDVHQGSLQAPQIPGEFLGHSQTITKNQETNRGVLAVLCTLLLKKVMDPKQDIRLHQAKMNGGFAGRSMDKRTVTPFLKEQRFPAMSESGWLTRTLEQANPYTLDYPGVISPPEVKSAFLALVDGVQRQALPAEDVLVSLLVGLIEFRDRNTNLVLSRPVNLSVYDAVDRISRHHDSGIPGVARLPVLAIHAIVSILAPGMERYRNCIILPLEHHNAADTRTDLIGDINIVDGDDALFEGYEIKHNIRITPEIIETSFQKFQTTPVKRFYILTTYPHEDYAEFLPEVRRVAQTHGCQLIVNGVDRTLLYYLRLLRDTGQFINEYVSNVETDPTITFQLKEAWNSIVQT